MYSIMDGIPALSGMTTFAFFFAWRLWFLSDQPIFDIDLFITSKQKQRGTTRLRLQSANTRQPLQMQSVVLV